jgi:hypothetical protein
MTPKKSNVLLNSASFKGESISEQIYMGCDERNGHGDRQKAPLQLSGLGSHVFREVLVKIGFWPEPSWRRSAGF